MRTILALSALHLAHNRPAQREFYQAQALSHHQLASRKAMGLLSNATADNSENLFLFSILTMFFGKSSYISVVGQGLMLTALAHPRQDDDFLLIGESGFPNWLYLLKGTRAIAEVIDNAKRDNSPLAPIFLLGGERWRATEQAADNHPAQNQLNHLRDFIKTRELPEYEKGVYIEALRQLHQHFAILGAGAGNLRRDFTEAFAWIFRLAEDFMPLLKLATKEAITIFAHWCVLIKHVDNQWWIQGWAEHLIAKAYSMLDVVYRLWIRWPMEEIGWSPP